eukprot:scaffold23693_cov157-Cylindrotheca_fusiformis.AAC.2
MSINNMQTPFSQYGVLTGQLFLYGAGRAAFESPPATPPDVVELKRKKCILVGGLSDGLCPVPYTQDLEMACQENDWSLVQPILSSSYTGFGHGSLDRDCAELEELMRFLIEYRNAETFCLVGHSTGCQDAVHFLKNAQEDLRSRLKVVALQAPVSDRESGSVDPTQGADGHLTMAQALVVQGNGREMMPRAAFWAPITAQRFLDLNEKGGKDDYFSSDYTDAELSQRLQHVGKHDDLQVLVAFSGSDEFVPSHIDKPKLVERLVGAMNGNGGNVAQGLILPTGNHNLARGPNDRKILPRGVTAAKNDRTCPSRPLASLLHKLRTYRDVGDYKISLRSTSNFGFIPNLSPSDRMGPIPSFAKRGFDWITSGGILRMYI